MTIQTDEYSPSGHSSLPNHETSFSIPNPETSFSLEEETAVKPDESFKQKDGCSPGGPSHHCGEGAPHKQINTWACGHSSLQIQDQKRIPFLKDGKKRGPFLKDGKKRTARMTPPGPNIAWWTTWWTRMEREAENARKLARTTTKITRFSKLFPDRVFLMGSRSGDVIKERHPESIELRLATPNPKLVLCEAKPDSGMKRTLEGGTESPAKRRKNNAFKKLLNFWEGPAENRDFTENNNILTTCLKNATHLVDADGTDKESEMKVI